MHGAAECWRRPLKLSILNTPTSSATVVHNLPLCSLKAPYGKLRFIMIKTYKVLKIILALVAVIIVSVLIYACEPIGFLLGGGLHLPSRPGDDMKEPA